LKRFYFLGPWLEEILASKHLTEDFEKTLLLAVKGSSRQRTKASIRLCDLYLQLHNSKPSQKCPLLVKNPLEKCICMKRKEPFLVVYRFLLSSVNLRISLRSIWDNSFMFSLCSRVHLHIIFVSTFSMGWMVTSRFSLGFAKMERRKLADS